MPDRTLGIPDGAVSHSDAFAWVVDGPGRRFC
jgi:hypothetical protein